MASGFSAKLPVARDLDDGYALTKTLSEVATQNLKNLLLTNPGERMMDPEFGVGLLKFLFEENSTKTDIQIDSRIKKQVSTYLSYIDIQKINFMRDTRNENLVHINLVYRIIPTKEIVETDFSVSSL